MCRRVPGSCREWPLQPQDTWEACLARSGGSGVPSSWHWVGASFDSTQWADRRSQGGSRLRQGTREEKSLSWALPSCDSVQGLSPSLLRRVKHSFLLCPSCPLTGAGRCTTALPWHRVPVTQAGSPQSCITLTNSSVLPGGCVQGAGLAAWTREWATSLPGASQRPPWPGPIWPQGISEHAPSQIPLGTLPQSVLWSSPLYVSFSVCT